MWNPFTKDDDIKDNGDPKNKMNFLQRMAMKKIEKMSPEDREKMMQDAFKPKNRKKLLKEMDKMVKSGMMSKSQVKKAKERMGIYE